LCEQIDADESSLRPEVVGRCEGHHLVRLNGAVHGVPDEAWPLDLLSETDRQRVPIITRADAEELQEHLTRLGEGVPVEFAGWLPIYEGAGNCGQHPQFKHTNEAPPGYRFTRSAPRPPAWKRPSLLARAWEKGVRVAAAVGRALRPLYTLVRPAKGVSLRTRWRVCAAMFGLLLRLLRQGCSPVAAANFLRSRHLYSQLLLGEQQRLAFLTSMPYTFGQTPWVIEIEDPTTLFYPMIQNGHTADVDVRESPFFPIVRTVLEADSCKAILTHVRSTAEMVPVLFGSEAIKRKVVYAPLGVPLPRRHQRHEPRPDGEPIDLLFINSWCQVPENFYVRGGLDVLEAFATLRERYPQVRLTIRSALPALDPHYLRLIERGWVRVINRFVTAEEMAELHAGSHVFLLPAARIHIVSLLQAMSYGLAVVASDGWGMQEYLEHERTGLIVGGRYGKTSWADYQAGLLRENYEPTYTPDPEVVGGMVEAVSRLVEDPELRARLGRAARAEVESKYNLENWNRGLKAALDLATGADARPIERRPEPSVVRAG
jgi:glycosyltransferase involved in cell wall biosynthesis